MQEPSFKKLSPETQIQILFLLSNGYEKIQQSTEQILLLNQQLKRSELIEYIIPLKAALIHAYLQQKDMKEADILLKQLLSLSHKKLSTRDKKALSHASTMRDHVLFSMIREAKEYLLLGKFQKASFILEKVFSSITFEPIPCQSSPLSQRKIGYSVLFSLAECSLLLGKPSSALEYTSLLLKEGTLLPPILKEKTLLLQEISQGNSPKDAVTKLSLLQPERATHCLLWHIQNSLYCETAPIAIQSDSPLAMHYMRALEALQAGNSIQACFLFKEKRNEALLSYRMLKKQYLEGYQEALWLRCLTCFFVHNKEALEKTTADAYQLFDILDKEQIPSRKKCFLTLVCMCELNELNIAPSPQEIPHAISQELASLLSRKPLSSNVLLSFSDRLFLHTVAKYLQLQEVIDPPVFFEDNNPLLKLFSTLFHVTEGSYDWKNKEQKVEALLTEESLQEARAKILHMLLSYALTQPKNEKRIPDLVKQFLLVSGGYSKRKEALFDAFLYMDTYNSCPIEEKKGLFEELFQPPYDKWNMLLLLHLSETGQLAHYCPDKTFDHFLQILHSFEQAKSFKKDAYKTQEPGQKTDLIRHSLDSFQEAEQKMRHFLKQPTTLEKQTVCIGVLFKILSEWSDLLFSEPLKEHPFLDLDAHLKASLQALQSALAFHSLIPDQSSFTFAPKAKKELKELIAATDLFLYTFTMQYEEAISCIRTFPPESLFLSTPTIRSTLYLIQSLRKRKNIDLAWPIIKQLNESEIKQVNQELALQVAIEKSLCLKEKGSISQAMACLAWVINDSAISSLRIKAMVLRADLYMLLKRPELAIRQLEAAKGKGGEWGVVAVRKLQAIQEEWQGMPVIIKSN
jgi:hypothetical protein